MALMQSLTWLRNAVLLNQRVLRMSKHFTVLPFKTFQDIRIHLKSTCTSIPKNRVFVV